MTTAIKKLIENIDQLVSWLNENPSSPMPSNEKKRAITVLNKIIRAEEISDEEWEKLKPQPKPVYPVVHTAAKQPVKRTDTSSKNQTINVKKPVVIPFPPPVKQSHSQVYSVRNNQAMIVCSECKSRIKAK